MGRLIFLLFLVAASTGCRTTHDATEDELATLGVVSSGIFSSQDASGDQGEGSVAAMSGLYGSFIALRKDDDPGPGPVGGAGLRIVDEGRDPWPDCVVEVDDGVEYNGCEFGASGDDVSVAFFLDGYYHWTDNSAEADLQYDFGIASDSIAVDWTFLYQLDLAWTDTTLDGELHIDYDYGITTGSIPTPAGVTYSLDGTIEALTWDEACDGIVSGTLDWTYHYVTTGEPPENGHVTVVWTGCDTATITW